MPVAESIHGHDVIHMIQESASPWSRAKLLAAVAERFGAEARFHTCSVEGMDATALIDFLESKGKFLPDQAGIVMDPTKVCNHG
ncbi:MAG: YecH family protein [Fibrobacterota bacterium]|nr:YecH family protein [Fibrobacterota bacterium]QQS07434.1 MAG: YecH family protein [Fibrobacterota bacterium]